MAAVAPLMARARRLLVVAALTLVAASLVMLAFERRFIYFPARDLPLTPRELGMSFEDVALTAEDGVRLHGWYLPTRGSRLTVLLSHGNAGNIADRLDRALLIQARLGADVFLYDYRGYGRSQGSPDEEGTYRDARAAYAHLTGERHLGAERVVLFGESLGCAVAMQLALERPCRALVLESAFTSVPQMARVAYPFLPLAPFVRTRYDNLAKAPKLKVPLLLLHGDRDRIVPFEQGRRVFEAAPEPKRFYAIAGADHNDTYVTGGTPYWDAWRRFLDALPALPAGPG
jgi:pimeloyl-ACP methyl ester carboxylesterase